MLSSWKSASCLLSSPQPTWQPQKSHFYPPLAMLLQLWDPPPIPSKHTDLSWHPWKNRISWLALFQCFINHLLRKFAIGVGCPLKKLMSPNCYFCLLHFFENCVNWDLAKTIAQFSLFWKLVWSYCSATQDTQNCSLPAWEAHFFDVRVFKSTS